MKPSVGRIVHYGDRGGEEPRAAIITRVLFDYGTPRTTDPIVHDNAESSYIVSLLVHDFDGDRRCYSVSFSDTLKPGHWTWPPRTG